MFFDLKVKISPSKDSLIILDPLPNKAFILPSRDMLSDFSIDRSRKSDQISTESLKELPVDASTAIIISFFLCVCDELDEILISIEILRKKNDFIQIISTFAIGASFL